MTTASSAILLYCRAGFEADCAAEIMARAAALGVTGYVRARDDYGYLMLHVTEPGGLEHLGHELHWQDLVFPRQWLLARSDAIQLPPADRVTPILQALRDTGLTGSYADLWLEYPDTNEGKQISGLARRLRPALVRTLAGAGIRMDDAGASRRLHLFFPDFEHALIAETVVAHSTPFVNGIPRLRQSRHAPSRSGLKLDEAIQLLMSAAQRDILLAPGGTAADLGAAPGGWTWQLVRRHMHVTAVDNGPMQADLMDSGLVEHQRADGFRFRPAKPVDLVVCDMVEKPARVAALMAQWLDQGWCRAAIFNLKLPMRTRYRQVTECLARLPDTGPAGRWQVRCRHLYHDRDEVTVCVLPAETA